MKAGKITTVNSIGNKKNADKANPFAKLREDKKRNAKAVNKNISLSSFKDIKFVRPL